MIVPCVGRGRNRNACRLFLLPSFEHVVVDDSAVDDYSQQTYDYNVFQMISVSISHLNHLRFVVLEPDGD